MKDATRNAGEFRNNTCKPPRSHDEALSIIREARERRGKPDINRVPAQQLVRDNLTIITELRDRGHRQEDAVLLILEVSHDAHKPDTIRKAIRAIVGDWVVAPPPRVSPTIKSEIATNPNGASAGHEPAPVDEDEGVTVL